MSGIIAVDIDGTLVGDDYILTPLVVQTLREFASEGWHIVVITGRSYSWAKRVLHKMDFPFHLAVQNGAMLFEMPSGKLQNNRFLDKVMFLAALGICIEEGTGLVVYDHIDQGHYCKEHFEDQLFVYLKERAATHNETWHVVETFDSVDLSGFPSMKCFGDHALTARVSERLIGELGLAAPQIRDPYRKGMYVTQATAKEANKGKTLSDFIRRLGKRGPIIVAGDDHNDHSMLAIADVKVVMSTAPKALHDIADIVAPPAEDQGIVTGLKQAMERVL